jgi:metallo-beta-lactamase class B
MFAAAEPPPEWSQPVKPFRIAQNIYYVGTKGLSAYLVGSKQGAILLEGTTAENATLIERNIKAVGVPLTRVRLIVSDHAHYDHVGGIARIKRDTGAVFDASAGDAPALRSGVPGGETDYEPIRFPPVAVDHVVHDGETVRVGDVSLTANLTPGHTPGCTTWSTTVRDGGRNLHILFLCSLTVAGNVLVGNRAYPTIVADYERTFAKLSAMRADIVLTSHPEMADILQREARVRAGDLNAFIDPRALPSIVAKWRTNFEHELAEARRKAGGGEVH